MNETKLSSYRVTDLPQLTDLNNQDLFLITHAKDTGGYESQSIPFNRLMRAVKRRGFKEEIQVINDLNINAARKTELTAEAAVRAQQDVNVAAGAKQYTDNAISKLHTHANLSILSAITNKNISQWNNDIGYLSSHREYSEISAGIHLSDYEQIKNLKSAAYQEKEYFAISSHNHDTKYYSKDETDQKISGFVDRSDFGSAAFTESSDYLAEQDFGLKYTTGQDILQLSVRQTVLSVKIETSGGESGTTYEYVHNALSNDGYALKTRIRIWED